MEQKGQIMKHVTRDQVRAYFKTQPVTLGQAYKNLRKRGYSRKKIIEEFEVAVLCSDVLGLMKDLAQSGKIKFF